MNVGFSLRAVMTPRTSVPSEENFAAASYTVMFAAGQVVRHLERIAVDHERADFGLLGCGNDRKRGSQVKKSIARPGARTTRSITPHTAPNSKSFVAGLFALTSAAAGQWRRRRRSVRAKKRYKTGERVLKAAARPEERATWNKTPKIAPVAKASLLGCLRSPQRRPGQWRRRRRSVRAKKTI